MSAGGALVGLMLAGVVVQVLRRIDDPMIEVTLTVIAAYGSFAVAEQLGVSGVIATVVAGLICGRAARAGTHKSNTIAALRMFWKYVAFALNSIVFLLIGMDVRLSELLADWKPILLGYASSHWCASPSSSRRPQRFTARAKRSPGAGHW